MDFNTIIVELGLAQPWEKRADGLWVTVPDLNVENVAAWMAAHQARFVTITARPAAGRECCMEYHWDIEGQLLTFVTQTHKGSIASISALCPAADWVEREIHDYFSVDFLGRPDISPLMLRSDDRPGIFSPDGGQKS
jgi:Ni,Fe-hydrogenase III component G